MTDDAQTMTAEQTELRLQIDESRAALAEKLEMLEDKVAETVQNASASMAEATASVVDTVNNASASVSETVESVNAAVQGTVENVRCTVSDTVESVRGTFDLPEQVRKHPWEMFGAAIALGYFGGSYLRQMSRPNATASLPAKAPTERKQSSNGHVQSSSFDAMDTRRSNGFSAESTYVETPVHSAAVSEAPKNHLQDLFGDELTKLKGLAVGISLGLVRDMIADAVPPTLRPQIAEMMDGFTEKLGGAPIKGPILPSTSTST